MLDYLSCSSKEFKMSIKGIFKNMYFYLVSTLHILQIKEEKNDDDLMYN